MTSLYKKSTIKTKHDSTVNSSSHKMTTKAKVQLSAASNISDEDSELEMERNFTLLSKKNSVVTNDEENESVREREEDLSGKVFEEDDCSENDEESDGDEDEEEDEEKEENLKDADEDSAHSESDDREGKVDTENDIKKELSTMSFEDIMTLQNKVGTKVYNEIAYGTTKGKQPIQKKKRLNKNRPMEISAKRPAPYLRQVIPVKKAVSRDPRFDDLSGEYKPEIFEKTYKFINDIKQREKDVVQKRINKTKMANQKEKLQFLLKRMENQERARKSREEQREKELEFKRKQREMAGQGLKPYFLKKSDKKKLELADKYNELKRSGKLENFLSKKRKRNAGKDRRKLPFQHKDQ
ncbi:ribosomal RNA processing protein 36 homolog [Osmerus mordax]|uniref:ribosomal RNA processing protein 36 homolog n=1 Tax=Osmerus mordax TaxID=8014 RepID=UPI0035108864